MHPPPIWQAVEAELERRAAGWKRAIEAASHSDDRWRLTEQRAADLAKWHVIAIKVARKTGVPGLILEELTEGQRPAMPVSAEEWLALLAYVRRAVDREASNADTDVYLNLYAIWRWLHLYINVWAIPAFDLRPAAISQRKAA